MSPQLVSILAQIAASQARIAGMQANNQHCLAVGSAGLYTEEAFLSEAQHLEFLANEARNA